MTETEARAWVEERFGAEAADRMTALARLVEEESDQQNLISAASLPAMWTRHLLDSAQLALFDTAGEGTWIDVGTGAGFPGMVTAIVTGRPTLLVEPRRRRADFLTRAAAELGLPNVEVEARRIEQVRRPAAAIISARAVAGIGALFQATGHVRSRQTIYILPRGRSIASEVAAAQEDWTGMFHVEQSLSDPSSGILIAHEVTQR